MRGRVVPTLGDGEGESDDDQYDDEDEFDNEFDDSDAFVKTTNGYVGDAEQLLRRAIGYRVRPR